MVSMKKLFTNVKILVLIFALVLALVLIHPSFKDGVAIRSIQKDSVAMEADMVSPSASVKPMSREVILSINTQEIKSVKEYHDAISLLIPDETFTVKTNRDTYYLTTRVSSENSSEIEDIGITVYPRPKTNIRKGLDLEGGTRVLLKPDEEITPEDLDLVINKYRAET
jgi:hypothetical protein